VFLSILNHLIEVHQPPLSSSIKSRWSCLACTEPTLGHIERAEKVVTNVTANKVAGALGTTCRACSQSWSGTRMIQLPDKRRVHHDYLSESYLMITHNCDRRGMVWYKREVLDSFNSWLSGSGCV